MAIDFPNSPSINDVFTVGSTSWTWNGATWNVVRIPTGATGPSGPSGPSGSTGPSGATGPEGPATVLQNSQSSSYSVVASDNGKYIDITTGGVTIDTSTAMTAGQNFVIYNNSGSSQTITATGVTLRLAGTATTGNRTIPQYGLATVLCVASNTYVISGPGLS